MNNRLSSGTNALFAQIDQYMDETSENVREEIRYETPSAKCVLSVTVTQKTADEKNKEWIRCLAEKMIAQCDSPEEVYKRIFQLSLFLGR